MINYKTTEKGRALLRNKNYAAKVAEALSKVGWNPSGNYSVKIQGGEVVVMPAGKNESKK